MKYSLLLCFVALAYGANPICQLKPEQGMCEAYIPSYYYDPDLGECNTFIYGGCGGNENRFRTREECERACSVPKLSEDVCSLEPDEGICLAYMPRYYYDVKKGQCQKFIYGGCRGNANNFKTLEECENACIPGSASVPVCEQKLETGRCLGHFPRYYYDKDTRKCSGFIYGGCGGNQNNFGTEEECLEACSARSDELPVCEQDAEPGMCDAYFPRYYYNKHIGKCEMFIYGGCGGNQNNFKTEEECEKSCQVSETESLCELDAESGPCYGYFRRYYYNKEKGECQLFVYGGCQGNANNFKTKEECQQLCAVY